MLTKAQFDRSRALAMRVAGIELFERHREFLCRRMRRAGVDATELIEGLLDDVEAGHPQAEQQFVDLVATVFTGFFRHPWHFDIAVEHALWAAHRRDQARLWSSAAATGEEPYSLAMALIELFRQPDPPATILATDISQAALAVAERGEYSEQGLGPLEPRRRERFFNQSGIPGRWNVSVPVRRLVEFRPLNLASVKWAVEGPFDVILCRNVLMYLEVTCRDTCVERMARLLAPDGVLILDPTEHLGKAGHLFSPQTQGVYLRRTATPVERVRPLAPVEHGG